VGLETQHNKDEFYSNMRSVNLYYSSVFQDSNKPTLVQFRCKRTLSTSVSRCKLHKKNRNP